jgi:predicted amidohydrolase YtcJ
MVPASTVLVNGRVVPVAAQPDVSHQAVAVDDGGRIAMLGTDDEVRALVGPRTRVIDLRGRLALPAFADAHVHAVGGGFERLHCNLLGARTRDECLGIVAAHARTLAPDAWVLGGGWALEAFGATGPLAADLVDAAGGRPVFLPNRDHHSAWVSAVALQRAGIDRYRPDPPDGRIERDAAGAPTGTLHEGSMRLVGDLVPAPSLDELTRALLGAQHYLHSLGITRWQDAAVGAATELGVPDSYPAYQRAASDGTLTARVVGALWWDRGRGLDQIPDLLARREAAGAGAFRATSVKIMVDGVCETLTAAMTEPYLRTDQPPGEHGADDHGDHGANDHGAGGAEPGGHRGHLFLPPEELDEAVAALDAHGFQVHFHALGDRAVTVALDALAALPAGRVRAGRHHLAHLQFVRPSDLGRFATLGAVANFQPLWACNDPQMEELTVPVVGPERVGWQYRIGTLARLGTTLAFGSDWPVSSPDPLQQLHVAVNRRLSGALGRPGTPETDEAFLPDEAISLPEALDAFTRGVAFVNGAAPGAGVLRAGARADIAVLDHDILRASPLEIGDASVDVTLAGGRIVHGDE